MTVISFELYRQRKDELKLAPVVMYDIPVKLSDDHNRSIQEFTSRWHQYELQHNLNKLFSNDLKVRNHDYLEDVSSILEVEQLLKIRLMVMPSDFINRDQEITGDGRAAVFKFGTVMISTPLLPDEAQARMFAILLKHKLTKELKDEHQYNRS